MGRHPRVRHGRPLQPGLRRRHAAPGGGRPAHASSASATRGRPRSPPRPTASSPVGRRPASASPARDPPTCSPGSTTPRSTVRRCSPSPGRCRRRCSAGAPSRTSSSTAAFADVAGWSRTVLADSDHAELMTLAAQARPGRVVRWPIWCCPTRCRCDRCGDAPASGPSGRVADLHVGPPEARSRSGAGPVGPGRAAGDRGRATGPASTWTRCWRWPSRLGAPVLTTFKAKGQISDRHPLGAGVLGRSGTPVASWLMNESRPAGGVRGLVLEPHRHRRLQAHHPGRLRPDGPGSVPPRHRPGAGPRGGDRQAAGRAGGPERVTGRPARRRGRAVGHLARGEAPSAGRRPRPRSGLGRRVRFAEPAGARRRGDRRRRGQQHLLVRALLRVRPPVGADVGVSGLDRVRVPGGHGGLGRRARPSRSWP